MVIEREYYEPHPIADIFPMLSNDELNVLADDIKENGLEVPITLFEGKILDGRNRFQACMIADVDATFVEYTGDDPLQFVVSHNLHRRHLNESQRAMAAARIANGSWGGYRGANGKIASCTERTQKNAADMLNVSERSVRSANKVKNNAVPEVIKAVESGKVPVSLAADLADAPAEKQKEVIAKDDKKAILAASKEIRKEMAAKRRQTRTDAINEAIANNTPLDGSLGTFAVIYADPPWQYDSSESDSRAIENQYPTMTLDEIGSLDVPGIAHDDAVLFLWTTSPKLQEAFQVLDAWGFTYRTCAVWDKEKMGMGYYFRQQHELLLVATKGKLPTPLPETRPPSVIRFPRGEHSQKPDVVYLMIEEMYPDLPKIELFCRSPREGWTAWGNQM
ncbi:MAG: MT-A70 family methyltransferase [Thermoguttaceae bacterium]|nr:MT-A70 family methyltransferase [Thermoguttaceae bacterium]